MNDYVPYIPVLIQDSFWPFPPQEGEHCVGEYLNSQQILDRRIARPGIGFPDVGAEALPTFEGASSYVARDAPHLSP